MTEQKDALAEAKEANGLLSRLNTQAERIFSLIDRYDSLVVLIGLSIICVCAITAIVAFIKLLIIL